MIMTQAMKHIKYLSVVASGLLLATSCTDVFEDTMCNNIEKPNTIAELEYLNEYPTLKEALSGASSRAVNPNFMLGVAVGASEFLQYEGLYALASTNFTMVTPDNAMKYGSIVSDKGEMDFGTVKSFLAAAEAAQMQVFGHTLCWNAQQNTKWLNKLIADKELEIDPDAVNIIEDKMQTYAGMSKFPYYVMVYEPLIVDGILTCPAGDNGWYQFIVMDGLTFVEGRTYTVTAKIKGSEDGSLNIQLGNWGALKEAKMEFTTEWSEVSVEMPPVESADGFSVFQPGTYKGKLEIEWVKLSHAEAPAVELPFTLIDNGDASKGESANLISRVKGNGDVPAPIVNDPERGPVYKSEILANPVEGWDCQFFIKSNEPLEAGEKVQVHFWYRADDSRKIDTQAHGAPGSYHHWACIGSLEASTEWKEHTFTGTVGADWAGGDGFGSIAFNLSSQPTASCFYIDDVEFNVIRKSNTIPLTPEEKYEAIDGELNRWVKGMMDATEGKVKAWSVVNEPLQDGSGELNIKNGTDNPDPNSFYWQDILGENYVQNVVKYAREHYAEQEGAIASELKLFVNENNLESFENDNAKCRSLINWINKWESDGTTKIDGIGTEMHVKYYLDADDQAKNKAAIENMLKLLKDSGKLIYISELQMALVDEIGNEISADDPDVTIQVQKNMGEFYKFIVQKYFEIIPENQQYGICLRTPIDTDKPVGLWNKNYQRKPQYGGFADGLQGK